MTFTVVRSQWYHGNGSSNSRLVRREDAKMCCLGFMGCALKIPIREMLGAGIPSSLTREFALLFTGIAESVKSVELEDEVMATIEIEAMTKLGNVITEINDMKGLPDNVREIVLTALFEKAGHEIKFVD